MLCYVCGLAGLGMHARTRSVNVDVYLSIVSCNIKFIYEFLIANNIMSSLFWGERKQ